MVLFELSKDNPYTNFACGLDLPLVPLSSPRRDPYRRHGQLKALRVTSQNKFAEPSVSYFSRTVIPFFLSQRRVKEEGGK